MKEKLEEILFIDVLFAKTFNSAMNDKSISNKRHKMSLMREQMFRVNDIKEEVSNDKFSKLVNNILGL